MPQLESLCRSNQDLSELFDQMIVNCKRYAETVFRFEQIVLDSILSGSGVDEARREVDKVRGTVHDATIDSINILARNITKTGGDSSWIKKLASGGRPSYGKFVLTNLF